MHSIRRGLLTAGLLLSVTACSATAPEVTRTAETSTTTGPATTVAVTVPPPTTTTTSRDERTSFIEGALAAMTLDQKVAQLLMVEFSGSEASSVLPLLEQYEVGGLLMKSANGNFVSTEQVRRMTDELRAASPVPLLVAVDQEGGRIDRIRFSDVYRFPAPRSFGVLGDPELTEAASWATGVQLAALGINVDFAPVADVNVLGDANPAIGDRSYGDDPSLVAKLTGGAVRGFQRAGVAAAVKHFPGHGNTAVDSHLALPVVQTDPATWEATDLVPFAAAVDAGVPMVMVAHVAFPALDAEGLPASLSSPITTGRLRAGLGFKGVIVTDDLANMQAVADWSPGERAVRALQAGADLLLNPGDTRAAVDDLKAAVEGGRVAMSTVDAAVSRILGLKYDLGLPDRSSPGPLDAAVRAAVEAVVERVAAACLAAAVDC